MEFRTKAKYTDEVTIRKLAAIICHCLFFYLLTSIFRNINEYQATKLVGTQGGVFHTLHIFLERSVDPAIFIEIAPKLSIIQLCALGCFNVSVKATSENRLPAGSKRACRSVNPLHL